MHYEDLAPCPGDVKEEKKILEKMWGDDWEETFATDVRNKYDKFLPLADDCRRFNMTKDDVYKMNTVRHLNQLGCTLGNWVKSQKGGASPESVPLVEKISWLRNRYCGSEYISEPLRQLFLDCAAAESTNAWPSFEEMFFPSGKNKRTRSPPPRWSPIERSVGQVHHLLAKELMDEMSEAFENPLRMMLMMTAMAGILPGSSRAGRNEIQGAEEEEGACRIDLFRRVYKQPAVEANEENAASAPVVSKAKGKAAAATHPFLHSPPPAQVSPSRFPKKLHG
ncbi:hypothetical protein NCC49_004539 [Naganishia albida]|nr:hypothetical protein NCC49_004539 [Naganishia albida]